jgi:hypothetical protein
MNFSLYETYAKFTLSKAAKQVEDAVSDSCNGLTNMTFHIFDLT